MLLRGLTLLILMQLLGTAINVLLLPGQVIGMLLLFTLLTLRGEVGQPLQEAASSLLRYLPLLLIPIAVSSILFIDTLSGQLLAVGAAMVLSLLISLLLTGWLMEKLIARHTHSENQA